MSNIRTKDYWDAKFISESLHKGQEQQTTEYAKGNVEQITIGADFSGIIIDFGCALGDASPIYAKAFPKAKILGIDISEVTIAKCRENIESFQKHTTAYKDNSGNEMERSLSDGSTERS